MEERVVSHTITRDRSTYDDTAKMDTTACRLVVTQHTHTHTHKQFIASEAQTSWDLTQAGGFHLIGLHMHCGCRDNSCPSRTLAARAWHGTELRHWWGSWKLFKPPRGFHSLKFICSSCLKMKSLLDGPGCESCRLLKLTGHSAGWGFNFFYIQKYFS